MNFLLYDNDCGICTKFAKLIQTVLGPKIKIQSMNNKEVLRAGEQIMSKELYWESFHVATNKKWLSGVDAIPHLASLFPLGSLWKKIITGKQVEKLFVQLFEYLRRKRNNNCHYLA